MAAEKTILPPSVGTELKICVTADIGEFLHLDDVDFTVTVYNDGNYPKELVFEKSELVAVDKDNYIAVVNTELIGIGNYWCKLECKLPDADCPDGYRDEIVRFPTYIKVVR